jgi:probable F420-dependent oxidoreductase
VKLDFASVPGGPGIGLAQVAETARELEEAGFDGLWTLDAAHDPYLPLVRAAASTERMSLGTAIATAFTRSPMVTAMLAWDLQALSSGRFILGLGTQVKGHNERRFSVPFESPGPRLRELVRALRHIWGAFQGEHELRFHGRFYNHDLMPAFFNPGPIEHPRIPIYLAAVRPYMYGICGEVADGVHVHPFHTIRYLRETALPALEQGLGRANRSREDVALSGTVFVIVGDRPADEHVARMQLAFYASTRTYRPVLEAHGWGDLPERVRQPIAEGDLTTAAREVKDEVLAEFVVQASSWTEATSLLRERYQGILDRVAVYGLEDGFVSVRNAPTIAAAWSAGAPA